MPSRDLSSTPTEHGGLSFTAAIVLHAAILAALMHYAVPHKTFPENIINVSLMAEPQPHPPEVQPPKPVPKRIVENKLPEPPKQIIVAQTTAQAAETAPAAPPPEPAPPVSAPISVAPIVQPDLKAVYADNPLAYPQLSQRLREQGLVMLTVTINPQGLVDKVRVAHSSGFPRLDSAALEQVNHWKFRPSMRAGQPITDTYTIPIRFSLSG